MPSPLFKPMLAAKPDPAELDAVRNRPTRGLDPEVSAYVEVWDEPKFTEG